MTLSISRHAVIRYMERVDRSADFRRAADAIGEIQRSARVRPRARWWTSRRAEQPGTRYLYSARHGGVCLVVNDGVVLTVLSRAVCRRWRRSEIESDR